MPVAGDARPRAKRAAPWPHPTPPKPAAPARRARKVLFPSASPSGVGRKGPEPFIRGVRLAEVQVNAPKTARNVLQSMQNLLTGGSLAHSWVGARVDCCAEVIRMRGYTPACGATLAP